jgi:hypothetical protein
MSRAERPVGLIHAAKLAEDRHLVLWCGWECGWPVRTGASWPQPPSLIVGWSSGWLRFASSWGSAAAVGQLWRRTAPCRQVLHAGPTAHHHGNAKEGKAWQGKAQKGRCSRGIPLPISVPLISAFQASSPS